MKRKQPSGRPAAVLAKPPASKPLKAAAASKAQAHKQKQTHAGMQFAKPMRRLEESSDDDGAEAEARYHAFAAQIDADNEGMDGEDGEDADDYDEDGEDDEDSDVELLEGDDDDDDDDEAAQNNEEHSEDAEEGEDEEEEEQQLLELDLPVQLVQATYSGALYGLKTHHSLRRLQQAQKHLHSKRGLHESDVDMVGVEEEAEAEAEADAVTQVTGAKGAAPAQSAATSASTAGFSLLFTNSAHIGSIKSLSVSGDGKWMVSGGSDESVRIFSTARMNEHGSLIHHSGSVTAAAFYGSAFCLTGGSEGALCIWRTGDWSLAKKFEGAHQPGTGANSAGGVCSLAVHPSGRVALSIGSVDRQCKLWDLLGGKLASSRAIADGPMPHTVAWAPRGELYVLASDKRFDVMDTSNSLQRREEVSDTKLLTAVFLTEHLLLLGCEDHSIRVHSIHTGECITVLRGHQARVRSIDVLAVAASSSADAALIHLVGSASTDGQTHLWDLTALVHSAAQAAPQAPAPPNTTFHPMASKHMDQRVTFIKFLPHWSVRKARKLLPVQTQEAERKQQEMMAKKSQRAVTAASESNTTAGQPAKPAGKGKKGKSKEERARALFEKQHAALQKAKGERRAVAQASKAKLPKATFEVAPMDDDDDDEQAAEVPEAQAEEEVQQPAKRVKTAHLIPKKQPAAPAKPAHTAKPAASKPAAAAKPTAVTKPGAATKPAAKPAAKAASKPAPAAAAASDDDSDDAGFSAGLPLFRPQLKQMRGKKKSARKVQRDAERSKKMQAR